MVTHPIYDSQREVGNRVALGNEFSLDNRADGTRSADGRIYSAAVYDVALDQGEVVANALSLAVHDDG